MINHFFIVTYRKRNENFGVTPQPFRGFRAPGGLVAKIEK
jgi:hypothetical protein